VVVKTESQVVTRTASSPAAPAGRRRPERVIDPHVQVVAGA
jgi:hypothetical protein